MNSQDNNLDFSKIVAIIVRGLRNVFGLSQTDLSTLAKVARPTLSKLEKLDTEGVRADTLEKTLSFFKSQGVDFSFDKHGVTLHIPNETLLRASILIQENTKARGSQRSFEKQNELEPSPLAKGDDESISAYIERLNAITRESSQSI